MEKHQKNIEMEHAVRYFEELLKQASAGTVNESLTPQFMDCSVEEKSYTAAIHAEPWMRNPWGTMHGGIIATALDSCMGIAAFYFCGERTVHTVSMQISYLAPVILEQDLVVRARVTNVSGVIQNVQATAWNAACPDRIVATAEGVYCASAEKLRIGKYTHGQKEKN